MGDIEMYMWKIAKKWGVSMDTAEEWCEQEDGDLEVVFDRGGRRK